MCVTTLICISLAPLDGFRTNVLYSTILLTYFLKGDILRWQLM